MSSSESVSKTAESVPGQDAAAASGSAHQGRKNQQGEWLLTVTSTSLRWWAVIGAVVVMAVHVFMAVVSGVGDTGATVSAVDQWAFIGIGVIISGIVLMLLRPRVRVNEEGVEVRNIFGAQFYRWSIIHGLSFPRNARWARLELPDFEFVPMMAFQVADKSTIATKVEDFRVLEDRYMPDE
ncbi:MULTISPECIES: PH domain-containing protein [unclassified Corynebacterium]|uniref:PH domain-containing protein n=1 Tax=unclassified Corynebacterium TaxID=2624378 RepID=UPI000A40CB31